MIIYMFESERVPNSYGFSLRENGDNLPRELGPWSLIKIKKYVEGERKRTGVDVGELLADLENVGFRVVEWG